VTDSERFYNSVLELLDDPEEKEEVDQLITWWNRSVAWGFCRGSTSNTDTISGKSSHYMLMLSVCHRKIVP
jgi:hypothetical protein